LFLLTGLELVTSTLERWHPDFMLSKMIVTDNFPKEDATRNWESERWRYRKKW
jgi:hypothetical protein